MLHGILPMLEPYEVKVSRTVLRGLGTGNSPRLPDVRQEVTFNIVGYKSNLLYHQ